MIASDLLSESLIELLNESIVRLSTKDRIGAVKLVRGVYGLSLRDSKNVMVKVRQEANRNTFYDEIDIEAIVSEVENE